MVLYRREKNQRIQLTGEEEAEVRLEWARYRKNQEAEDASVLQLEQRRLATKEKLIALGLDVEEVEMIVR